MTTARPLLMSGPMVRSTIDGIKTQTRRIVKPQPFLDAMGNFCTPGKPGRSYACWGQHIDGSPCTRNFTKSRCPYGKSRDLLWVRERAHYGPDRVAYSADNPALARGEKVDGWGPARPSIHMPRWASRLTLEITDVRVERLQDISEEDAKAEGLKAITKDGGRTIKYGIPDNDGYPGNDNHGWEWREWCVDPRRAYFTLWDKINGDSAHLANPWVWVLTFAVHHANVDAVLAQRAEVAA